MSFLNLWALWIAAAVVPALLILYFLKLRRREQLVPSTLLWKRAVQDLQVNAPFQRLRKSLLLLLQLLVLALVIFALARPIVETTVADEERLVLLIDRSASMNAVEAGGDTRLEQAKEQAVRLVKTLNRRTDGWRALFTLTGAPAKTQVMVIGFADRASVVAPFTTNTSELEDVIRSITPTEGGTDLSEALELAEAYMAPPTMTTDKTPVSAEAPAKLVLVSDGKISGLDDLVLRSGTMERIQIGATRDNVGITTLRTQRNYEQPERLSVFLSITNFGPEPVATDVSIYVDNVLRDTTPLTLAGRTAAAEDANDESPSEAATQGVSFRMPVPDAAVIEARLSRSDALTVDDRAWAVVPPPRKLRVLVVTEKNALLDFVLSGLPLAEFPFITPAQWEANDGGAYWTEDQCLYDTVIFDKVQPEALPLGNYLFLRALPPFEGLTVTEQQENHNVIWWDETHPVLRHVALEYVYVAESDVVAVPKEAEVLAEGPAGPCLFRYSRNGRLCLVQTFAVEDSNIWRKQAFGIFMYNAMRYLGGVAEAQQGPLHPGEALRIPLAAGTDQATLIRPDGRRELLTADAAGFGYYAGTDRVGLYRVEDGLPNHARYAVNLENPAESDIAPPTQPLKINVQEIEQLALIRTATPEVWRWFIGAALALVLIEWWIYNRRVMI